MLMPHAYFWDEISTAYDKKLTLTLTKHKKNNLIIQ